MDGFAPLLLEEELSPDVAPVGKWVSQQVWTRVHALPVLHCVCQSLCSGSHLQRLSSPVLRKLAACRVTDLSVLLHVSRGWFWIGSLSRLGGTNLPCLPSDGFFLGVGGGCILYLPKNHVAHLLSCPTSHLKHRLCIGL